jgi:hypothetical protein
MSNLEQLECFIVTILIIVLIGIIICPVLGVPILIKILIDKF